MFLISIGYKEFLIKDSKDAFTMLDIISKSVQVCSRWIGSKRYLVEEGQDTQNISMIKNVKVITEEEFHELQEIANAEANKNKEE